jgi:hypothetical protein
LITNVNDLYLHIFVKQNSFCMQLQYLSIY